jgi:hypothetical protein
MNYRLDAATEKEQRAFASKVALLKEEAMRIGLVVTAHSLEAAVKQVGWELAELIEARRAEEPR